MAFRYGKSLHGGELVTARSVCDLQGADGLVAGDDLPVGVLYRGDVALVERPVDEAEHQARLAHTSRSKNYDPVVVALLRHFAVDPIDEKFQSFFF